MSEIKVDNLTGKTSAGDITVTSEGGAATMQLQQGLAKAWVNFDGTVPSLTDSFNIASVADYGTGDHQVNLSNSMSNGDYSLDGSCSSDAASANIGVTFQNNTTPPTSSLFRLITRRRDNNTNYDNGYVYAKAHGDLS